MSTNHRGNLLNEITFEEHDGSNNAKRVNVVAGGVGLATVAIGSAATIFAVVNTSAAGQASVVIDTGRNFIGIVTVANPGAAAAGNVTLDAGSRTGIVGNLTLSDSKGFIGLTTVVQASSARTITGNLTLSDAKTFIGLTTATLGASPAFIGIVTVANPSSAALSGNVTLDAGSRTGLIGTVTIQDGGNSITVDGSVGILGNVTLSDSKGYIGLVTVTQASAARTITGNLTLSDSKAFIGLVTVGGGLSNVAVLGNVTISGTVNAAPIGNVTLSDSKGYIGLVTVTQASAARTITGNLTLSDSKGFIGLVTVVQASAARTITGNLTLSDSKGFIGLVTAIADISANFPLSISIDDQTTPLFFGNVTLTDSKGFIGLVTAVSRNAGTTKTLIPLPVGLGNNSLLTVAVPTNSNKINLTQLILNSNVTTEVAIKSGVTYLTGNASLGITLYPGGGFVMNGAPDSPAWIGLPSGAMVIEKRDGGGTVSKIGGNVIYFDE